MSYDLMILIVLLVVAYALCRVVVALGKLTTVLDAHTRQMHQISQLAWGQEGNSL